MLKNYRQLSVRYAGQNKKRITLTLFGIVLSMALISTIGLFIKGAEMSRIQQTRESSGLGAHLVFQNPTGDTLRKVQLNPNIASYGFMKRGEAKPWQDITFQMYTIDAGAGEFLKYALAEGRMPQSEKELCIDQWARAFLKPDLSIGDTVELYEKKYTVTGFLKSQGNGQQSKISRAVTFDPGLEEGQLLVEIREGRLFEETLNTVKSYGEPTDVAENSELTRIQLLGTNRTMLVAGWLVIGIVVLSTIIVIYNAFQINLAERTRQFGLLRCIGATKKQICRLVFREATWMCALAVPMGAVLSIGVIYVLQWILNLVMGDDRLLSIVCIDPGILLAASVLTVSAVYFSCFVPAYHAGNVSPLAAVNNNTMIRKESIKKGIWYKIAKHLNFKAGIAMKNVWRNPKRCVVMLLSIVVSATLFITFSTLTGEAIRINNALGENQCTDVEISMNQEQWKGISREGFMEQIVEKLPDDRIYLKYPSLTGRAEIPEDRQIQAAGDIYTESPDFEGESLYGKVSFYDEGVLPLIKEYLIAGTVDEESMASENGVILVVNGIAQDTVTKKRYIGELSGYRVNDTLSLADDRGRKYTLKIVGLVENDMLERESNLNTLSFISTSAVRKNLTGEEADFFSVYIDLKDEERHIDAVQQIDEALAGYPTAIITDYVERNNAERNSNLLFQILIYGFISVITLISAVNIVNTITMNIESRRKELSVLKSIGMSRQDLKKMILYEGLFYGLTGGVIGAVSGSASTYAIYSVLSETVGLAWRLPLGVSITAIIVSVLISFLSALLPLKKIGQDDLIETIRMG